MQIESAFPPGHFYSPIVDSIDVAARADSLWPPQPKALGIDFNEASHLQVLVDYFPKFIDRFDYIEEAPAEDATLSSYYTRNSEFGWLDARVLFVLMQQWRPQRIIEVGSGYSSLLMADVNARFLDGTCDISCVEPYPRPFLSRRDCGVTLIEQKVQDVPLEHFERLASGDVLFIDSSHVAKTGSDVNYLFFEVLPRLQKGVRIHIHDVFLPHEYPREWVIDENRSWNEQYLVRALLMYSSTFQVVFGSSYAFHRFPDEVAAALKLPRERAFGGGSLWIERTS